MLYISFSGKVGLQMKKYEQIIQILRHRIASGEYTDKLPTEKALMEEFGVSRVTVRKSIEILQKEMPLRRSKKGGTHILLPQNEKNAKRQLVLLMPNSTYESIEIITGVEEHFSKSNLSLTVKFTDLSVKGERAILEELLELDIAGFLIYPAATSENRDIFLGIMERNIPLVFIDRSPSRMICSSVSINNQQTAIDVVNYLHDQGHRRIAFFASGLRSQQSTMERLWGFTYAMSRRHLAVSENNLFAFESPLEMQQCFERFFTAPIKSTAVFCSDDVLAGFFIQAATQRGYRIPEDFSVVGIDDKAGRSGSPVPLTTVRQPYRELGRRAAQVMDAALTNNKNEVTKLHLQAELIIRDSVRSLK